MGRPSNKPTEELLVSADLHPDHKEYDECLINVKRKQKGNRATTTGVEIRKILRTNVRIDEGTKDSLNSAQDHQNAGQDGMPVIKWYFPAGVVGMGMDYPAKDIIGVDEDGEQVLGQGGIPKIAGLEIALPKAAKKVEVTE